jgi:hypothetical protein
MKHFVALGLVASLGLVGCSSAFKTAGTPDDVYYSYGAAKPAAEEERYKEEETSGYSSYFENADDRYLRMKVQDRARWSTIDDVNYWYGYNNPNTMWNMNWNVGVGFWNVNNPWAWNNAFMWNNPWAFNNYYNSWNNPWCWNRPVVIVNKFPSGTSGSYLAPRPGLSRSGYTNSIFDRGNYNRTGNGKSAMPQSAGYGTRELFRSVFGSGSGSNGSSQGYSRPARLFDNSGSSSGGSIFNSGGGGSSRTSGGSSSGSSSSGSSSGGSRGGRGGN